MLTFDDISKIYNTQNKSGFNSLWEHNSRVRIKQIIEANTSLIKSIDMTKLSYYLFWNNYTILI